MSSSPRDALLGVIDGQGSVAQLGDQGIGALGGQLLIGVLELLRGEEETPEGLGGQLPALGGEVLVLSLVASDGLLDPPVEHVADVGTHVLPHPAPGGAACR